jgi:hypothetical protein
MSYSFYLFTKLYDVIIGEEYEYDLMYENLIDLYHEYESSSFNDSSIDEYQCMVNFLHNNKNK